MEINDQNKQNKKYLLTSINKLQNYDQHEDVVKRQHYKTMLWKKKAAHSRKERDELYDQLGNVIQSN